MKFVRKSIMGKAIFLFLFLSATSAGFFWFFSYRGYVFSWLDSLLLLMVLMFLIGIVFFWNIFFPLSRLTRQVMNLLTGKTYHRVKPTTIDEVAVVTHFFNEITQDLEKVSYDLKERRRMSSELDIASNIQRDVMPKEMPEVPGLDIVAKTRSAAEVGGDTFDFLTSPDDDQVFIYIGDVTGHGVPSGLIMMMVETLVSAMVYRGVNNTQDLVIHTNNLLQPRISSRLFMTSVMFRWDKVNQKMYYTGAGHEHILVYRHVSETVEPIVAGGIALGMIPDVSKIAKEREIPLEEGDAILLYTDGITEAKNHTGEMYGLEQLTEAFRKNAYKPSAEAIFEGLTRHFSNFVREYVQNDDITMMVMKYVGKEAATGRVKLTISKEALTGGMQTRNWSWD